MSRDHENYTVGDFIINFPFWEEENDRQFYESKQNNYTITDFSSGNQLSLKNTSPDNAKNEKKEFKFKFKQPKLFKVKKFIRYEEILKEICPDEDLQDNEIGNKSLNKQKKRRHIGFSKNVNFSKLSSKDKNEKLKNLSKLVKLYRRKIQSMENRLKQNIPKIFKKYLYKKLGINIKNKYLNPKLNFDLKNFINAQRQLLSHEFEYNDQRYTLINLINLIADKTIHFESIQFKKICSQVRLFLPKDKIKYISKTNKQSSLIFKEKEAYISKIEYDFCAKYRNDEKIMRTIFGITENCNVKKDLKIIIEEVDEDTQKRNILLENKRINEPIPDTTTNLNKLNNLFTTSNYILHPQIIYNENCTNNHNNNNSKPMNTSSNNNNNTHMNKSISDIIMEKYGVLINPNQILPQNFVYPNQLNAFLLIDPNFNK